MTHLYLLLSLVATATALSLLPTTTLAPSNLTTEYSDDFARNKMLQLQYAVYTLSPAACIHKWWPDAEVKNRVFAKCDKWLTDSCKAFVAALPSEKAIVLTFAGTTTATQLFQEVADTIFKQQVDWPAGGKVASYFYDAFSAVWDQGIRDDLKEMQEKYPGYKLWIFGHSLGAAMATLIASNIVHENIAKGEDIQLYTIGLPRTGDKDFALAHDKQNMVSYRITHSHDPVPHVPPRFLNYYHHLTEVFYPGIMSKGAPYKICSENESSDCSNGVLLPVNVLDHIIYFGTKFDTYAKCFL